jgi:hypothetical protein
VTTGLVATVFAAGLGAGFALDFAAGLAAAAAFLTAAGAGAVFFSDFETLEDEEADVAGFFSVFFSVVFFSVDLPPIKRKNHVRQQLLAFYFEVN